MCLRLYLPHSELEVNLGHIEKSSEKEKGGGEEGKKKGSRGRKV